MVHDAAPMVVVETSHMVEVSEDMEEVETSHLSPARTLYMEKEAHQRQTKSRLYFGLWCYMSTDSRIASRKGLDCLDLGKADKGIEALHGAHYSKEESLAYLNGNGPERKAEGGIAT